MRKISMALTLLFVAGMLLESICHNESKDSMDLEDVFRWYANQVYPNGEMPIEQAGYWADVCHHVDYDPYALMGYIKKNHLGGNR